jgi:hypothetical protein
MNIRRPHPAAVLAMVVAGMAAILWLASCHSAKQQTYIPLTPAADKITTPERVRAQQQIIDRGQKKAVWAGQLVTGLTRDNVDTTKPQLSTAIGVGPGNTDGVIQTFSDLSKSNGHLVVSAAADATHAQAVEKENTQIKDADRRAQKERLNWWGLFFLICSVSGLAVVFAAGFIPLVGPIVSKIAGPAYIVLTAGVAVGLCLLTLATFLVPIEIAIAIAAGTAFIVAVVLLIIWLVRKWKQAHTIATEVVDSIDKGVAAGQIIMQPVVKDPDRSVVKLKQSPATEAFVNDRKKKRAKKLAKEARKRAIAKIKDPAPPPPPPPAAAQPDLRPIDLRNPLDIAANGTFNVPAKPTAAMPAAPPAGV